MAAASASRTFWTEAVNISAAGDGAAWPGLLRELAAARGAVRVDATRGRGVVQHRAVLALMVREADGPAAVGEVEHVDRQAEPGGVFLERRGLVRRQAQVLRTAAAHRPAL